LCGFRIWINLKVGLNKEQSVQISTDWREFGCGMSSLLCSNDDFSTAVSSRQLQSCQFQRQRRLLHENPRLRVSEEECFYFVEQRPSSASSSFYLPTTTTTQQYENEYGNANVPEICVHPTVRWRVAEAEAAAIIDDGDSKQSQQQYQHQHLFSIMLMN